MRTRAFRRRYDPDAFKRTISAEATMVCEDGAGVVYLALGPEHVELAALSAAHARRVGYDGPIRIVTDETPWPFSNEGIEIVRIAPSCRWAPPRHYKTRIYDYSYPVTLFLDADMLPIAPINAVWRHLGEADLALVEELPDVQSFIDYYWNGPEAMRDELELMQRLGLSNHPFYNSGVLLFRRTKAVACLFDAWHEEWRRFGGRDQPALVRALARTSPCAQRTLPRAWNTPPSWFDSIQQAREAGVKILHFFSGPQRDRLRSMLADPSAAAADAAKGG